MPLPILAEFEFKHLIYLVFFVLWILGQYFESQAKKKKKREREQFERATQSASESAREAQQHRPDSQREAPVEVDLKKLLEQLTGQPAPPPPPVARPTPPPAWQQQAPPPLPQDATMEQVRAQSQQLKNRLKQQRSARAAQQPPPAPSTAYELHTLESSSAPAPVDPASISVGMRSQNVGLPQMKMAKLRSAPSSPMRATADAQRLAWIKNPRTLRQIMVARLVLDPPKALEGVR